MRAVGRGTAWEFTAPSDDLEEQLRMIDPMETIEGVEAQPEYRR